MKGYAQAQENYDNMVPDDDYEPEEVEEVGDDDAVRD